VSVSTSEISSCAYPVMVAPTVTANQWFLEDEKAADETIVFLARIACARLMHSSW